MSISPKNGVGSTGLNDGDGVGQSGISITPEPPAPSCSITLEAPGVGSAFGASALDVNGQTASITLPASPDSQYSASSVAGLEIGTFSGRRTVEHVNSTTGSWDWTARGFYDDPPATDAIWRWAVATSEWVVIVGGSQQASYSGANDDPTAVVLVDNGDVEFWLYQGGSWSLKNTVAAYSSGNVVKPGTLTQGGVEGDTMSVEFVTSGYTGTFSSADDWCGNAL